MYAHGDFDIRLLGPLHLARGTTSTPVRGQLLCTLLAVLAVAPNVVVATGAIEEALWRDTPPARPGPTLRMQVSRLRTQLAAVAGTAASIAAEPPGYVLGVDERAVDHVRFSRLIAAARADLAAGRPAEGADRARAALALWRGRPFGELDVVRLTPAVVRLEAERHDAVELLLGARLTLGETGAVLAELQSAVEESPDQERLAAYLMIALHRTGRPADALAVFRRIEQHLREELGVSPSAALRALERAVLDDDAGMHGPAVLAPWLHHQHPSGPSHPGRLPARRPPDEGQPARAGVEDAFDAPGPADERVVLPASLSVFRRGPFVGRDRVLDELVAELGAGLHVVVGPPGVGKSRVLAELAGAAVARGVLVLHGWAQPDAVLPLGLLRNAIAALASTSEAAASAGGMLLDLLDGEPVGGGGVQVQALLAELSRLLGRLDAPSLLVLDDAHWADSASLAALRDLVRRGIPGLTVVLGARPDGGTEPWQRFEAELSSLPGATVRRLQGLDEAAVVALVDAAGPDAAGRRDPSLGRRLRRATGGNPFLLTALLRELGSGAELPAFPHDAPALPVAAAAAVARRLEGLPARTLEALRSAAILGATTDVATLAELEGRERASVAADLAPAVAAGVLRAGERQDEVAFEHDLVRSAVLDGADPDARRRLHAAAARTLAARSDPSTIAYHLFRAHPEVPTGTVVDAMRQAASHAVELTAWAEAASIVGAALDLLEEHEPADHVRRIRLLLLAGRARMGADGRDAAIETFEAAARLAVDVGRPEMLGDVVVAASRYYLAVTPGDPVRELLRWIVAEHRDDLPAGPLSELAVQHSATAGADRLATDLLAVATRKVTDPDRSAPLLRAELYVHSGSPDVARRRALADALVEASGADAEAPTPDYLDGLLFQLALALLAGDVGTARAVLPTFDRAAEALRAPVMLWLRPVIRADLALQEGRFEEAARQLDLAVAAGRRHRIPDAAGSRLLHRLTSGLLRGDAGAVRAEIDAAAAQFADATVFRAAQAACWAEIGDHDGARRALGDVVDRLSSEPPSITTPFAVALAGWAGVEVATGPQVELLVDLLRPWSGTVPRTALVGAALGPLDRTLGLLELRLDPDGPGRERLVAALRQAEAMGAAPWSAWCRQALAAATTDSAQAGALLAEARAAARHLGLDGLRRRTG